MVQFYNVFKMLKQKESVYLKTVFLGIVHQVFIMWCNVLAARLKWWRPLPLLMFHLRMRFTITNFCLFVLYNRNKVKNVFSDSGVWRILSPASQMKFNIKHCAVDFTTADSVENLCTLKLFFDFLFMYFWNTVKNIILQKKTTHLKTCHFTGKL